MKYFKLIYVILCALALSACSVQTAEPDELELIRAVAIDASESGFTVTVCTGTPSDGEPTIISGEGTTIEGALRGLQSSSPDSIPFYSHTHCILIGEKLARRGIGEVLDYISRSSEMRLDTGVVICRGSAGDAINGAADEGKSVYDSLRAIEKKAPQTGEGCIFTALDAVGELLASNSTVILAVSSDSGKLTASGFGVIQDNRLVGYIPPEDSLGVVVLKSPPDALTHSVTLDGVPASFGLSGFKIKYDPNFGDGVRISVSFDAYLTEIGTKWDPSDAAARETTEKALSRSVCDSVARAVGRSQRMGSDCLGIGTKISMKSPKSAENWSEKFQSIPINISVSARLAGSRDTDRGLFYQK